MAKFQVQPGDRFFKNGTPPSLWAVERMLDFTDVPPHVRLIRLDDTRRTITVAASVLADAKQFRRAPAEAD